MERNWKFEEINKKRGPQPWQGILLFLLVMLSFYTIIAWMQRSWGMYGLAATELFLLALTLLAGKLCRVPFRVLFPVKKPQGRKILAVFLGWISSYAVVIPVTMTVAYFFPREMFGVTSELNSFIYTVPGILIIVITCVLPGICEEALHRGFLLKSFQSSIRSKWLLVLLMGCFFGLFHGSVWRFLPTAFLGAMLTYIMIETENMVYPVLFHFINNLVPSLLAGMSSGAVRTERTAEILLQTGIPLSFLGVYLAMACIAPFGFYTTSYLLRKESRRGEQKYIDSDKRLVFLVVLTVLPVLLGIMFFFFGLSKDGLKGLIL